MNKIYISKNYRDKYTASSKAKYDCEKIAEKLGYANIGLRRAYIGNKFVGQLYTIVSNVISFLRMPRNGVVFLQYPVAMYKWQMLFAKRRNNKVITLIHDLNALRGVCDDELRHIERTDVLIVHTSSMKKWCESHLRRKEIVVLEIFDYLQDGQHNAKREFSAENKTVCFAGNLGKSPFLDKLELQNTRVELFGIGIGDRRLPKCCVYKGCFAPNELSRHLTSMFGLVWDGKSVETCSGAGGEYLRMISPHKLSMYLSSGLPVFVWKESAMADFVIKNGIGYAIGSLPEIDSIMESIDCDTYNKLLANVEKIKERLTSGYYLTQAIK